MELLRNVGGVGFRWDCGEEGDGRRDVEGLGRVVGMYVEVKVVESGRWWGLWLEGIKWLFGKWFGFVWWLLVCIVGVVELYLRF